METCQFVVLWSPRGRLGSALVACKMRHLCLLVTFVWLDLVVAFAVRQRFDAERHHGHDGSDAKAVAYSNRWIVHLDTAHDETARLLAHSMGCELVGAVRLPLCGTLV